MYDKITDRVKKLIALALGTHSQEEARTAAKMAVDLIAQHRLLDRPPGASPTAAASHVERADRLQAVLARRLRSLPHKAQRQGVLARAPRQASDMPHRKGLQVA